MADEGGPAPVPPVGVRISTDLEQRSYGIRARARWTDPHTKKRIIRTSIVADEEAATAFFDRLRDSSDIGIDRKITLADYTASIGDRWSRGLDPTSTRDGYPLGLRLRVLPALGHLPVSSITAAPSTAPSISGKPNTRHPRSRTRSHHSCASWTKQSATTSSA